MKKTILFLSIILAFKISKAQMPVTDAAVAGLLSDISATQKVQQTKTVETSANTIRILDESKKAVDTGKKSLQFLNDVEQTFWKVDNTLKKGYEIQEIINLEKQILIDVTNIRRNAQKLPHSYRIGYINETKNILQNTQRVVDVAISVLTDNIFKMTTSERQDKLEKIRGMLSSTRGDLKSKMNAINSYLNNKALMEQRAREYDKFYRENYGNKRK